MKKCLFALSLIVPLASCATTDQAGFPRNGEDDIPRAATFGDQYAEATFVKGYQDSGVGVASAQAYFKSASSGCDLRIPQASFYPMSSSDRLRLLHANRTIVVTARTSYNAPDGYNQRSVSTCVNQASFTPLPNARYEIVQRRQAGGECRLQITDRATQQSPADLALIEPAGCIL